MISVTLSQLTDILNGELQGADITLDAVTTDTRKLTPGCLFVALKGERFDAHDFADQAKAGGAGALLVSALAHAAFTAASGQFGNLVVALCMLFFARSTLI